MHKVFRTCPSCGGDLIITELSCTSCDTVIRGRYTTSAFEQLSEESLRFLELFVTSRGNIKEMERETGLGYWTIRGHLDDIIEELSSAGEKGRPAANAGEENTAAQRRAILEAVERGDLSLAEAEQQLRALS